MFPMSVIKFSISVTKFHNMKCVYVPNKGCNQVRNTRCSVVVELGMMLCDAFFQNDHCNQDECTACDCCYR